MAMREPTTEAGWRALLAPRLVLILCVLLGGVLLHSMNVLITATLLPSIVAELGGANLMSWPTTAFVASSIIAASDTSLVSGWLETAGHFRAAPSSTRRAPCCAHVRPR
jgi:MFS family permease